MRTERDGMQVDMWTADPSLWPRAPVPSMQLVNVDREVPSMACMELWLENVFQVSPWLTAAINPCG